MKYVFVLFLTTSVIFSVSAQLNLKNKLERKTDQVVDDLLFGKKKSKGSNTTTSNPSSSGEATEVYKSENETAPNGGYVRKPVDYGTMSSAKTVHFSQLIDFLPDDVGSFSLADKPDGATMRYGEYNYSYGSKEYENGDEGMTIMISDYLFTAAMFGAYANAYEYETTEGMMKSVEVDGYPGWFSTTYESGDTQLVLIINNRFMLNINQKGASEADLKEYAQSMPLDKLPQGEIPEQDQAEESDK